MLDEGNCLRDQTLALCQRYGVNPPIAVATTLATVVGMMTHGVGTTVIPKGTLRLLGSDGAFAVARFAEPGAARRIGLVHRTSSSRGEDFTRLAEVVTNLARDADLPMPRCSNPWTSTSGPAAGPGADGRSRRGEAGQGPRPARSRRAASTGPGGGAPVASVHGTIRDAMDGADGTARTR